jgi:uncharacterized protein YdeI (YjbR/CyaY-like superfamily)
MSETIGKEFLNREEWRKWLEKTFSPKKKNSIWSKSNKETAKKMMQKGKMTPAGFETINEAKSNGKWSAAYSSKTAPVIPMI